MFRLALAVLLLLPALASAQSYQVQATPSPVPIQLAWGAVQIAGGADTGPTPTASPTPTAGPVAWTDAFARTGGLPNTDLTANCDSEGPNDNCDWVELGENFVVNGNERVQSDGSTGGRIVGDGDSEATGLNQYTAARMIQGTTYFEGISIRDEGLDSGGSYYVLRHNATTDFRIRSCDGVTACADIAIIAYADLTPASSAWDDGDSLGIEVDDQTGDDITFTIYHWDDQAPPDRGSWGTGYTVCDATPECDQVWDVNAPSNTTAGVADTGKLGGIYSGGEYIGQWDDWMFGDNL